jgi:predicted glycoside hydrolase/deacetylase ChbG (UPF0249 family)
MDALSRALRIVAAVCVAVVAFASATYADQQNPTIAQRLGYPADARLLIIHADDFGMSHSINRGIEKALENGWVTSASVMVPCPWYPEALAWARSHPGADIGLHLTLNSEWPGFRWGPVAPADKVSSLLDPDGYFFNDPSLFTHVKMTEVETELHAQIDKARAQHLRFSHLDSHMIALMTTKHLFTVLERVGHDYDLPIALIKNGSFRMPEGVTPAPDALALDAVVTMDPGVGKSGWFDWYKKHLTPLRPGIYELVVHLAYDDDEMRGAAINHPDWGAAWRQQDLDMLGSSQFRQFLRDQHFVLVNWTQLSEAYRAHVHPHF